MKRKRFRNREEFYSELERRWLRTVRPPSRTVDAINTIIFVLVLAALLVAAYLNRARITAIWQQARGFDTPDREF
jgi:hypothetical protein